MMTIEGDDTLEEGVDGHFSRSESPGNAVLRIDNVAWVSYPHEPCVNS